MQEQPLVEEGRYSFGSTPFVDKIIELIEHKDNIYDTIAINISTILRNVANPEIQKKEWVQNALGELFDIVGELSQLMQTNGIVNPCIALYYASYDKLIPVTLARNMTPNKQYFEEGLAEMLRVMKSYNLTSEPINGDPIIYRALTNGQQTPASVSSFIKRAKNKRNVLLITHIPLDYHISRNIRNVIVVQSHTGEVVERKDFNKKVFKLETVPFTIHTHALLGDKVSFKSQLKPKLKKELIELSTRGNWNLMSESQVKLQLKQNEFHPMFKICY